MPRPRGRPRKVAVGFESKHVLLEKNEKHTDEVLRELHDLLSIAREKNGDVSHSIRSANVTLDKSSKGGHTSKATAGDAVRQAAHKSDEELDSVRNCLQVINRYHTLKAERRIIQRQVETAKLKAKATVKLEPEEVHQERQPMSRSALMRMLSRGAISIPLWSGKHDEDPPQLCGRMKASPEYVCPIGGLVVISVEQKNAPSSSQGSITQYWLLTEVTGYNKRRDEYELDDIDEVEHQHYTYPRKQAVPLPIWRANPETNPDALFPEYGAVLALYPQTTCFYKGKVEKPPSGPQDDYLVCFEDHTFPCGFSPPLSVPQRYVVGYL